MGNKKYDVRFLPLFEEDLYEIVAYITEHLKNPVAANKLIDDVENAIIKRSSCAESFEPYHSVKERKYPYYRIYVGNYVVYYVVIDDVMAVSYTHLFFPTQKSKCLQREILTSRKRWILIFRYPS